MSDDIRYGIVGDGRLARHFQFYLAQLGHDVFSWSRRRYAESDIGPTEVFAPCDIILVLIKDEAIESFIRSWPALHHKTLIHCSGALSTKLAYGVHPLMTFTEALYPIERYAQISFIIDESAPSFSTLFPKLTNRAYRIASDDKVFYHALCVLLGNGLTVLGSNVVETFRARFGFHSDVLKPYLEQVVENLFHEGDHALTGPWQRRDIATIEAHLHCLSSERYDEAYRALMALSGASFSTCNDVEVSQ